ncbi:MAG TPA: hypothetical protein VGD69_09095 [Herpetosiphonaceae bacterium]
MNEFTASIIASVIAGTITLFVEHVIFPSLLGDTSSINQKRSFKRLIRPILIYMFIPGLAFWVGTQLDSTITSLTQRPNVTITSHVTGDIIPQNIIISGTYSNLASDERILVYVHSDTYALGQVKEISNGIWRTNMTIGGKDEKGKKFSIGTVVMTKLDAQSIEQNKYKAPYLPEGSIDQSEILLTRER